mmetsp:Transcript_25117/g.37116  ORF Transcript_25117/g.37116 Transcript_25117/m.37116 type:complete len:99 (+) Transcript_25117:951-1247(+)
MATEPAAAAFGSLQDFPAKKTPPPFETWIITGEFNFFPASITALQEDEVVQLNAGIAYALSLAWASNFTRLSPVTTPGGMSQVAIFNELQFNKLEEKL